MPRTTITETAAPPVLPTTLAQLIDWRADATPDGLFAVDESDQEMSFAEYRERCRATAAALADMGVCAGDVVSWQLPTTAEALVLMGALSSLDAIQNPLLPIYREREISFITGQVSCSLLVVPAMYRGFDHAAMANQVRAAGPHTEFDIVLCDSEHRLPRQASDASMAATARTPDEVRWLYYTSGTTAEPKGARHTDETILAAAIGMVDALEVRPEDRNAFVFPISHIGGAVWLMGGLLAGCSQILIERFDPPRTVEQLRRRSATLVGAGTAFHLSYLAEQSRQPGTPILPTVRAWPGGAAPKPAGLHAEVREKLGGCGIVSGYGLTEAPILTFASVRDADEKLASTEGRPTPGVDLRVMLDDGNYAPPQVIGELRVKGPQLCKGYVDSTLDALAFDSDGYFITGDLGFVDAEGYVTITGRLKDVIIRKGENISAKEVEDALFEHPGVADVAVIGLPDRDLGELCCAVVVPAGTTVLTFDEMVAFLRRAGLAVRKIPERLELVPELPRNATGKVLKHEMRRSYATTT